MASDQKTTQQEKHKTNYFLTCFGFSSKSTSMKKKPEKSEAGRNKSFKLCWPKFKVIVIAKKDIILDPKAAALKASQNIMIEATKVHQLKLVDQQVIKTYKPYVLPEGSNHHQDNENESHPKSQSYCATCHNKNSLLSTPKAVKCSILTDKVSKDSLIGVSIMAVTLITMLIWGKLCAVLCMSALLYCIPLFRPPNRGVITNNANNKVGS